MLKTGTITLLLLSMAAYGATLHVPSQYPTIQSGINAAVDGDTVLVANGTYTGTGNKDLDFLGKTILVTSENGAETCIINCQNSGRGFYFHSGEDSTSVLRGFTITQGYVDGGGGAIYCNLSCPKIFHNNITGNRAEGAGGGIYCSGSSPVITDNDVTANYAYYGGGISSVSGFGTFIARNNICSNNADGIGGGIYCINDSVPMITGNIISQNDAFGIGGGIYCESSNPLISHNTINGNSVNALSGGGIYCDSCSSAMIIGNMVMSNSCMGSGGGIYCSAISDLGITANTISSNWAGNAAGGIYCYASNSTICGNLIHENVAVSSGGGILCSSNPSTLISDNVINGNTIEEYGGGAGGGICCTNSNAQIIGNMISGNSISGEFGTPYGGGISCEGANSNIVGNSISGNAISTSSDAAHSNGGGIYCTGSGAAILDNLISGNVAVASGWGSGSHGGGIYFSGANSTIQGNTLCGNSTEGYVALGGGIFCHGSSPTISNNTISGNSTLGLGYAGGGLYCSYADPLVVNCIFWGNIYGQIDAPGTSNPQVTYSDVQYGYTGTGNINADPLFVNPAPGGYHLLWGSPCIDSGDPNPIYNDPDGTRADMGAWHYDQSMPVRVLLIPYNAPILIPAGGGSFQYALQATNIASTTVSVLIWCDVTLPSGTIYGPVLQPVVIALAAGETLSRMRTQNVPSGAPAGLYHYNAYAVAAGDTSVDSFIFAKLGAAGANEVLAWANCGEALEAAEVKQGSLHPSSFILHPCSPNPFNPTTVLSFELRAASFVRLSVYDISGRLVAALVDGWRDAGEHEVTFDGSGLAAGIYLSRLTTGDRSAVQKLILMK